MFDTKNIQQYIEHYDVHKQKELLLSIKSLQKDIKSRFDNIFIRSILSKVFLYKERIEITLCKQQLLKAVEAVEYDISLPEELKEATETPIFITKAICITQASRKGGILIVTDSTSQKEILNPELVKAVVKSYYWNELLLTGEAKSSIDIQKMENLKDNTYIKDVLRLRFLAPDIIEKILNGTQPSAWNVRKLFEIRTLNWEEQRKLLST